VLHQTQQRGPRGHQQSAHLFLGQPVQAAIELSAVLVEEHLELGPDRLIHHVLGERRRQRRHARRIPRPSILGNQGTSVTPATGQAQRISEWRF